MVGKIRGLSASALKIIAMICMLTDHIGAILLNKVLETNGIVSLQNTSWEYISVLIDQGNVGYVYLAYQITRRVIGRLAFPIYCFLLTVGIQKTRNSSQYALRLAVFALFSEIPFDLAFYDRAFYLPSQNVFFTLLIGFLVIKACSIAEEKLKNTFIRWIGYILLILAGIWAAEQIKGDYGGYGVIAIALLYLFRQNKLQQIAAGYIAFLWESMACLAFIPIAFYNGKKGISLKYVSYLFYPLHLLLLYQIGRVFF